jgi:signal transduction histidine kinase
MINLAGQVAQGVSDASLSSDVKAFNGLALAKEQASQQRALLNFIFSLATGPTDKNASVDSNTLLALQIASDTEFADESAFQGAATPAEQAFFSGAFGSHAAAANIAFAQELELSIFGNATNKTPDLSLLDGVTGTSVTGNKLKIPLVTFTTLTQGQQAWDAGMGDRINGMQSTENLLAGNILNRANQLQSGAQGSALITGIITAVVLLLVLVAALLVARSLVLPLRRLRAGALNIASVQLPERVRLLSDDPESAATMDVAPINVASQDEIGQVARAFDQVHSEAVRLAGEQALLRSSFNAMFVNLSRRSQTLIERLARMIDNLEQNEDDPDRLGSLFSMDHLVTRMRRNSENLLLLAGHENPRKWSDSVPLADIARAATSEIEQYNRVTLNIPPGVSIIGQAVSDVVHLVAELVENATIFSPKDTQVLVTMQELTSGGVLIEVVDKGIGVSEARLTEMNWRLDNPPTIDVSVSRHMGLFAVARLAERHRVRVRLRPAPPQGLSALVWLPDSVIERTSRVSAGTSAWATQPVGARAGAGAGAGAGSGAGSGETVALASAGQATLGNGHGSGQGNVALEGRTASGWFRGGQDGASRSLAVGTPGGQDAAFSPGWGRAPEPGAPFVEPAHTDQTAAGLPVRVPRANMPPGAGAPDSSQGGAPTRTAGNARVAGNGHTAANGGKTLPKRSPEHARSRLAGFQRGTRRAEGQGGSGGQAPHAGEGTLS